MVVDVITDILPTPLIGLHVHYIPPGLIHSHIRFIRSSNLSLWGKFEAVIILRPLLSPCDNIHPGLWLFPSDCTQERQRDV